MRNKIRYQKNAPLNEGDKVICIHMDDEFSPVAGGTPGIVKSVANVFGTKQYYVKWLSGSSLALIEGVDQWRKVVKDDDEEELNESRIILVKTKKDILSKKQQLDEGIKDWFVGAALALATITGTASKAQAQKVGPDIEMSDAETVPDLLDDIEMSNLNKKDRKAVEKLLIDLGDEEKYFKIIDTMNSISPLDSSYIEDADGTKELINTMDVIRTKYYKKGVGPTYPVAKQIQYKGKMDSGEKFHDQRFTFPDYDEEGNYQMKKVPDIYTSKKGTAYTKNIYKNEKEKQKYYDKIGKEVSTGNYKSKMWHK